MQPRNENMYGCDKLQYTMLTAGGSGTGGGSTGSAMELLHVQHVQHMRDNQDDDSVAAATCMPITMQTPCAS